MSQANTVLTFNDTTLEYEIGGRPARLVVEGKGYVFRVAFDYPLEVFIELDGRTIALTAGYGDSTIGHIVVMNKVGDTFKMGDTLGSLSIPHDHECLKFIKTDLD